MLALSESLSLSDPGRSIDQNFRSLKRNFINYVVWCPERKQRPRDLQLVNIGTRTQFWSPQSLASGFTSCTYAYARNEFWHTECNLDIALRKKASFCSWRWSYTCQIFLMLFFFFSSGRRIYDFSLFFFFYFFKSEPHSKWSHLRARKKFSILINKIQIFSWPQLSRHKTDVLLTALWKDF